MINVNREIHTWHSPHLNRQMEMVVYGHYGFALLMFPTAAADYLEYERFHLIDAIGPFIDAGKLKAFSINSINKERAIAKHRPLRNLVPMNHHLLSNRSPQSTENDRPSANI